VNCGISTYDRALWSALMILQGNAHTLLLISLTLPPSWAGPPPRQYASASVRGRHGSEYGGRTRSGCVVRVKEYRRMLRAPYVLDYTNTARCGGLHHSQRRITIIGGRGGFW